MAQFKGLDILVASSDRHLVDAVRSLLVGEAYEVFATTSFHEAKSRMVAELPRLLIAAVNLGEFNGLHLAWYRYLRHPRLPSLIVHTSMDPLLRAEAQKLGAPFLVLPIPGLELLAIVTRLMSRHGRRRRVTPVQSTEPTCALPFTRQDSHRPHSTPGRDS
jgi:DNA-binding response OmpR family regulator